MTTGGSNGQNGNGNKPIMETAVSAESDDGAVSFKIAPPPES